MNPIRAALHVYLRLPYLLHRTTGTGAFGRHRAEPLPATAPPGAGPLAAALFTHRVEQFNEAACSAATVVTVVNAVRAVRGADGPPVGQREILDQVPVAHWKARLHGGHRGRRGLPLPLLAEVVRASLEACRVAHREVIAVQAEALDHPRSRPIRRDLLRHLAAFATRADRVVIAHFDQGALVPVLNIPHISPVGGFDPPRGAVTVLDVDPEQPLPYRVSFERFYRALASGYHGVFRPFGYGRGGYVCVRLD